MKKMKKTKKAIASLTIAGMVLSMVPFNVFAENVIPTRLGGYTAEQTAALIAEQTGWTGKVVLASSTSYGMVDALTAGPLATFLNAPILLTGAGNALNPDTKNEIIKLKTKTVYVTSGTAVISQGVLDELKDMGITVVPLGGFDRFETSVNIAKKMIELGAPVNKAAVVYGWLNQDAFSIASIASAQNQPILLTEKDSIPASVQAFLNDNTSIKTTDVIGGTGVISDAVKAQLPGATRIFGYTAYDTNVEVLKAFDSFLKYDNVFIANGITGLDALTGVPLAAKYKAGIVLTDGTVNEGIAYVKSKMTSAGVVTALGGTAVVPESVRSEAVSTTPPDTEPPVTPPGGGGGGGDTIAPVLSLPSASTITATTATLNFTTNEAGTYYYLIYAAADPAPDAATIKAQGAAIAKGKGAATSGAQTINVTGLAALTAYKAYVMVEDAAGNKSAVSTININTIAAAVPAAPSSITATPVSGTAINVHWSSSPGATSYNVYRDGNPVAVGTVTGTSFKDEGLTYATSYSYTVEAVNTAGSSLSSASVSATTFAQGALIVSGVTNGAKINHDVTITAQSKGKTVTVKDSSGNTIAEAPDVAVTTISNVGNHSLTISATGGDVLDPAPVTQTFEIDKTAPIVEITGVAADAVIRNDPAGVTLNVNYTGTAGVDYIADTKSVLLDGNPFDITQPIKHPGQHTVFASVRDAAGNIGTASVSFNVVWDTTAPVINIGGVSDGDTYNASATPSINLSSVCPPADSNQANYTYTATITKPDGTKVPYAAGTEFTTEGRYTIDVLAKNPSYVDVTSQKSIQFWIDTQAPTVVINGVQDNRKYNTSVTPVINFADNVAGQALLKANSQVTLAKKVGASYANIPYAIGDTISDEGDYKLTVSTKDAADRSHSVTKNFIIDKTAPAITVTGVTDGATYRSNVTMKVETTESAQLDVLVNGATVLPDGNGEIAFNELDNTVANKNIVITATDLAGNKTTKQINFSIDKQVVTNLITGVTDGQILNSLPTITFEAYAGALPVGGTTATLNGNPFNSGMTLSADGSYTLVVTTPYGDPVVDYSKTINFKVDRTPPTVDSISILKNGVAVPASPLYVKAGDTIEVRANVADDNLQGQSFSIDSAAGSVSGEIPMLDVAGVKTGTWTVGGGNFNNLVLNVTGKDKAGNVKKTAWSQVINIDNALPEVALITDPAAADGLHGHFKAANMTVKLQAVAGETITYRLNTDPQVQDSTGAVTITAQQGHNSLTYQVEDQAGNKSDRMTFNFDYDSAVPSAPVVSSPVHNSAGRSSTVNINGTVPGETTKFGSTVVVRKDGSEIAQGTVAQDGTFSINGVNLVNGENVFTLVAVDYAGNESLPTDYILKLDNTAPVLEVEKVTDTTYKVTVNETITKLVATFNGITIPDGDITGPDAAGAYLLTTPQPIVGSNALLLSALDSAGNLGNGSLTISYIPPDTAQSNLQLSENALMDIPAGAFTDETQMTVRTGTFAGDSSYKLLGSSLSFNFSEKPAQPVTLKILVGTGLKGVMLFHIADDGTIGDPIVVHSTTSALFDPAAMTLDEGYYLSDTGYIWLKTKNFSDYQAVYDDTPPVINFTVQDPVIRINKSGKLGGQMKLEGTVSDLDPLAGIKGIEINGISSPELLTGHITGKSFNIPLTLDDGQHKVRLTAEDSAENSTTVRKTFIVDATSPEFTQATLEGYTAKDGDVYVTNTDAVVLNYELTENAEVFVNGQSVGIKNGVNSLNIDLPGEGNNTFELKAIDPLGNETEARQTFTIRKDTVAPVITVQGVSDGGIYGRDLQISVISNEGLTPAVTLDGVPKNGTFTYAAAANPGMHTLTATVTDLAGNTTTKTISFTVDASTPTVTFAGISNGQTYITDKTLTITATDAQQVFLTKIVDNGEPEPVSLSLTDGSGSVAVPCPDGEQHTYTFVAMAMRVTDDGAIKMANQTVTFEVDKKTPGLAFTLEPVDKKTGSVSLKVTLDETADVKVYVNDSPAVNLTEQPAGLFVISNIPLNMGDNTIKLVATDKAGFTSTVTQSARRTVSVNSLKASNGQLVLTFGGIGAADLTKDDFTLTAKLNDVEYTLTNVAYANGVFTFAPLARAAQNQTLELSLSPSSTTTKLDSIQGSPQTIIIPANAAPAAPNVSADDFNNVINGINSDMEYSLDGGSSYTRYSSANPPDLSGNVTVMVRFAATQSLPAGSPKTLVFTVNKIALENAINNAITLINSKTVGEAIGNVPQAAKDAYQAAIDAATTVKNDVNATQVQVDAAVTALATATTAFNDAVITEVPASISSTAPPALMEADANDGSLKSGIVIIEIANGTLAADIAKADITAANLPVGMDFTVDRTSDIRLTINITGSATDHANTNNVDNLTFTIAKEKVTGAIDDLTSNAIQIIFVDSSPQAYDQFIDKIMEVYGSLSETDKTALQNARAALQAIELTDARWDSIIEPLLTPQVVALYDEDEAAAKAALIEFVKDFGTLQYSADRSTLEANLDTFRSNNRDTFRTLFGNDFTMDQFYSYLIAVQEALPGVINDSDVDLIELSGESNTVIKEQIIAWTKTAVDQVASTDPYTIFKTKLSDLGLSVDKLVDAQRSLGTIIDPTNAAEKAITLAAIRSQIISTIPDTMTVGDTIEITLSVTGVDSGAIELANLLDWYSSDETVAEITTIGRRAIKAKKAGTTIITAYKKGSTPGTSNYVVYIEVTVQ
jgi:putative cell wall-binding protein